jgi:hypothetical protein
MLRCVKIVHSVHDYSLVFWMTGSWQSLWRTPPNAEYQLGRDAVSVAVQSKAPIKNDDEMADWTDKSLDAV